MKIKYFKTSMWGDCYVVGDSYMRIITLTKDSTFCMADDEGVFEGVYKTLNINEEDYELMLDSSRSKDRTKVLGIVRKIHEQEDNKTILNEPLFKERIFAITKQFNPNISVGWMKDFENTKPLLK